MKGELAVIKGVSIKEGDVVHIKWKKLDEIISFYQGEKWSPSNFLQESEIDYNLTAITNDGHYRVDSVYSGDDSRRCPQTRAHKRGNRHQQPDEISINNHNHRDGDYFRLNEYYIESISVEHDAAETYFSSNFNISLMKIDGALFINGKMVTKDDSKLIDILENTISDLAIQKMLDNSEDKSNDD